MSVGNQTVGAIAAGDYRTLAVLERHGIDYVNSASLQLEAACAVHGADLPALVGELGRLGPAASSPSQPNRSWTIDALVRYIVDRHHAYVRQALPVIGSHLDQAMNQQRAQHPELAQVAERFSRVEREMLRHMMKEEQVLFPFMVELETATREGRNLPLDMFGTVQNPIRMMEIEHQRADNEMALIRELTSGFTLPADASASYRACFSDLGAFEADLRQHLHLEQNLLFPMAVALEDSVSRPAGA